MPKGYVILTEAIHDPGALEAYGRASAVPLRQAGADCNAVIVAGFDGFSSR